MLTDIAGALGEGITLLEQATTATVGLVGKLPFFLVPAVFMIAKRFVSIARSLTLQGGRRR